MWLKLFICTIQEELRSDVVAWVRDSDSMVVRITYPFMGFLEIDTVNGFETTRHGFLRITQTSQDPVCDTKTGEYAIIRDIKALES